MYVVQPKTTKEPLRLKQLIAAIDTANLVSGPREINYDGGCAGSPEDIYDFCTMSSAYYSQLGQWFDDSNEDWLKTEQDKRDADYEDVEEL